MNQKGRNSSNSGGRKSSGNNSGTKRSGRTGPPVPKPPAPRK